MLRSKTLWVLPDLERLKAPGSSGAFSGRKWNEAGLQGVRAKFFGVMVSAFDKDKRRKICNMTITKGGDRADLGRDQTFAGSRVGSCRSHR